MQDPRAVTRAASATRRGRGCRRASAVPRLPCSADARGLERLEARRGASARSGAPVSTRANRRRSARSNADSPLTKCRS
jgi:hypothetical protein